MSIKIAYLILCHKDPKFVQRTALKLTAGTENHVFIHVDKKTPLEPFSAPLMDAEKIHFLSNRLPVYWAGYNSIQATVALLRAASDILQFDRYVLLQGADYPIRSNKEIEHFFAIHPDTEFIKAVSETKASNNSDKYKYVLKHYMDAPGFWAHIVNALTRRISKYWPFSLPAPRIRIDGKKCEIYRGWAQIALTDQAVRYILDFYGTHPKYNSFFKKVFAADESYFHTIIYNSPFRAKTLDGHPLPESSRTIHGMLNLTYFEYPYFVRIYTKKEEFKLLYDSGFLYFRKAGSESKELLDYIDNFHASNISG